MKSHSESRIDIAGANGRLGSKRLRGASEVSCLFALCLLVGYGTAHLQATDLTPSVLWKGRAWQAPKNSEAALDQLKKVPEAEWESARALELRGTMMLEFAFGLHVIKEPTVHKIERGYEIFHILLDGEENGAFDLAFLYSRVTGELLSSRIDTLPKEWKLGFPKHDAKLLHVSTPEGLLFLFDLTDPFRARAAAYPDRS